MTKPRPKFLLGEEIFEVPIWNFQFVLSYKFSKLLIYHIDPSWDRQKILTKQGY